LRQYRLVRKNVVNDHFLRNSKRVETMLPIRKILCPTDFSDSAQAAFELACALARDYQASLVVLHVTPPPSAYAVDGIAIPIPVEEPYELRARLVQLYPVDPGVEVDYRILDGDAGDQIVHTARAAKVDVIVMSTHGRSGFTRLLMGSVAESVMRHAPCPVLTVRGPFQLPLANTAESEHQTPVGAA
jgi:nucleotide-binding universal stress UspA family protein